MRSLKFSEAYRIEYGDLPHQEDYKINKNKHSMANNCESFLYKFNFILRRVQANKEASNFWILI